MLAQFARAELHLKHPKADSLRKMLGSLHEEQPAWA